MIAVDFLAKSSYELLEAHELLLQAKTKLSLPEQWCQYAYAMDAYGRIVKPVDETAVRWDLLGAIASICTYGVISLDLLRYLDALCDALGIEDGVEFLNDNTDHQGLMEFLDRAIAGATDVVGPKPY